MMVSRGDSVDPWENQLTTHNLLDVTSFQDLPANPWRCIWYFWISLLPIVDFNEYELSQVRADLEAILEQRALVNIKRFCP